MDVNLRCSLPSSVLASLAAHTGSRQKVRHAVQTDLTADRRYGTGYLMVTESHIALAGAVEHDPLGALMLCHAPRPDRVIVAGRTVVQDGHLATADEHALAARLNERVADLFR